MNEDAEVKTDAVWFYPPLTWLADVGSYIRAKQTEIILTQVFGPKAGNDVVQELCK